jgi:hypothetical protein
MTDSEDMSSIVLFYYYDWLTDKKHGWKDGKLSTDQRFTNEINKTLKPYEDFSQ